MSVHTRQALPMAINIVGLEVIYLPGNPYRNNLGTHWMWWTSAKYQTTQRKEALKLWGNDE